VRGTACHWRSCVSLTRRRGDATLATAGDVLATQMRDLLGSPLIGHGWQ
jgi:hypothetical protein